jgi:hypothetical protein
MFYKEFDCGSSIIEIAQKAKVSYCVALRAILKKQLATYFFLDRIKHDGKWHPFQQWSPMPRKALENSAYDDVNGSATLKAGLEKGLGEIFLCSNDTEKILDFLIPEVRAKPSIKKQGLRARPSLGTQNKTVEAAKHLLSTKMKINKNISRLARELAQEKSRPSWTAAGWDSSKKLPAQSYIRKILSGNKSVVFRE